MAAAMAADNPARQPLGAGRRDWRIEEWSGVGLSLVPDYRWCGGTPSVPFEGLPITARDGTPPITTSASTRPLGAPAVAR
jgi:hypothetical protein